MNNLVKFHQSEKFFLNLNSRMLTKSHLYYLSIKQPNEKTVWSRQKNRKQKLFIILYGYQQDNNKIPTNQVASFKD